jgi:large subunit ribosomal protein L22
MAIAIDDRKETEELASARFQRLSPRKAKRVADLIRGKNVADAQAILKFLPHEASDIILKVLNSAVANFKQKDVSFSRQSKEEDLYVSRVFVEQGQTLKRFRARSRGRAGRIMKRSSHITVVIDEIGAK